MTVTNLKLVAVRGLPDGVVFCSHATRRAILSAYDTLVADVKPLQVNGQTPAEPKRLTERQVIALINVGGCILDGHDPEVR